MALPIGYEGYSQDLNSNNTPTFGYDGSSSEESSWSEWEDAESRPPCPPVKVLEKDSQTGPHVKIVITAKQSARLTEMWNAPHIFRYFCFPNWDASTCELKYSSTEFWVWAEMSVMETWKMFEHGIGEPQTALTFFQCVKYKNRSTFPSFFFSSWRPLRFVSFHVPIFRACSKNRTRWRFDGTFFESRIRCFVLNFYDAGNEQILEHFFLNDMKRMS